MTYDGAKFYVLPESFSSETRPAAKQNWGLGCIVCGALQLRDLEKFTSPLRHPRQDCRTQCQGTREGIYGQVSVQAIIVTCFCFLPLSPCFLVPWLHIHSAEYLWVISL